MSRHIKWAMTPQDQALCFAVRREVFIEEQGVSEAEEMDGEDPVCRHILALQAGQPAGAARLQKREGYTKIQRVCVPASFRGQGVGADIMRFIIEALGREGEAVTLRLGSQTHALEFYRKLGFVEEGDEYLDAGIPHKDMVLHLAKA